MLRWTKLIAPVAGLALVLGIYQAQTRAADDAPATGKAKISVTVVDKDGKPAADATVNLIDGKAAGGGGAAADPNAPKTRPTPIATATTDKDGKASFPNIADGDYGVMANVKGVGRGRAKVTVTGGADADVTLTLKAGGGKKKAAPATPADPATPAAPATPAPADGAAK